MLDFVEAHPGRNNALVLQVLLLSPAAGCEKGADIRDLFKKHLYSTIGSYFETFMKNFTLLIDSAAVMPTIDGASVPENVAF